MKPLFIMLCGISGSGKSTWALKHQAELRAFNKYKYGDNGYDCKIVSSDAIRGEIYGDESCQLDPQKVFTIMQRRTKNYLSNGYDVIYDATNLKEKFRIQFLESIKKIECVKIIDLFIESPSTCITRQAWRSRKVAPDVIWRQIMSFQPPHLSEGWDTIQVAEIHPFIDDEITDYLEMTRGFNQCNPHHKLTLDGHLVEAGRYAESQGYSNEVYQAALLHDYGKVYTRTFKDGIAHYYGHENVSAYFFFLIYNAYNRFEFCLDTAWLIAHHMDKFKGEKYNEKVRSRLERTGYNYLKSWLTQLEKCDEAAH